jgi:hypothetical protein
MSANSDQLDNKILAALVDAVEPVITEIDASSDEIGMLVIGGAILEENGQPSVQTFTTSAGYFSVIAEALYAELANQISEDNFNLFNTIRQVVHDLEEDLELDDEVIDEHTTRVLH